MQDDATDRRLAWRRSDNSGSRAVLLPTGSVEQHGPHLPLGTDVFIAARVAAGIAAERPDVLVAEPVPYGCSWHHQGFQGTISVRPATFVAVLVDVCESIAGNGALPILCNGHYGNKAALDVAAAELAARGVRIGAFTYLDHIVEAARALIPEAETAMGHACALETSLALHLWPAAVRVDDVPPGDTPPSWPDPHLLGSDRVTVVRPFEELNPTGVVGRPSEATAEIGSALFDDAVARCGKVVDRLVASHAQPPSTFSGKRRVPPREP